MCVTILNQILVLRGFHCTKSVKVTISSISGEWSHNDIRLYTHHIRLFVADSVMEALGSHPLDRDPGQVVLAVVVSLVNIPCQTKICHQHSQVLVYPERKNQPLIL